MVDKLKIVGAIIVIVSFCFSVIFLFFISFLQDIFFTRNVFAVSTSIPEISIWIFSLLFCLFGLYISFTIDNYKKGKKMFHNKYFNIKRIIIIGILIILIILYTVINIFCFIKIDTNGILNRKYGIKKEFISWDSIHEIKFDVVTYKYPSYRSIKESIKPRFLLIMDDKTLDIWQNNVPGGLNYKEIIKIINHVNENTNINIGIDNDSFEKYFTELSRLRKKEDIIKVFDYVDKVIR
jgi:uncharacterized membrane protein YsdA (DUF1294 family)